jgi:hypothetical protein
MEEERLLAASESMPKQSIHTENLCRTSFFLFFAFFSTTAHTPHQQQQLL